MKKILAGLGIIALGLLAVACGQKPELPTTPSVVVTQTVTNNIGGGLTDPNATASQCLPSEETPIRVDLNTPTTVQIGREGAGIDATPKSAAGKRSDGCNILQGISWSALPATTCNVPKPSEFNTQMFCTAAGTCQLTATVPGKGAFGTSLVVCQ